MPNPFFSVLMKKNQFLDTKLKKKKVFPWNPNLNTYLVKWGKEWRQECNDGKTYPSHIHLTKNKTIED